MYICRPNFEKFFSTKKLYTSIFTQNGLGHTLGDFSTSSSDHPGQKPMSPIKKKASIGGKEAAIVSIFKD
jgi:hypothetical protein